MSDLNKYPAARIEQINKVLDPDNEAEIIALTAHFKGNGRVTQLFIDLLRNFEDYYVIPEPHSAIKDHLPYTLRWADEQKFKNNTSAPGYMLRPDQVEDLKLKPSEFDELFSALGNSKMVKTFYGLDYNDGACVTGCQVWTIDWVVFVEIIDNAKEEMPFLINIGNSVTRKCGIKEMIKRSSPPCNLVVENASDVGVKEVRLSGAVAKHHFKGTAAKYAGWKWHTAVVEFTGVVEQDKNSSAFILIKNPDKFKLISIDS